MNACSRACGWCGRCESGRRPTTVCPTCGEHYRKGRDEIGDLCDACADAAWVVEKDRRRRQLAARVEAELRSYKEPK